MADSGGLQSEDLRHGGCQNCGSLTFSQEWFDVFNVVLCPSCKKEEELITKVGERRVSNIVSIFDFLKLALQCSREKEAHLKMLFHETQG